MTDLISWFDESEISTAIDDQQFTIGSQRSLVRSLGIASLTRGEVHPVDPDLPDLVLLHGITDCHLADVQGQRRNRIWLDPIKLVLGQYTHRLTLENDGVTDAAGNNIQTDGMLNRKYAKAINAWRSAGFLIHPFCYDWRKSVLQSTERLGQFLGSLPSVQIGRKVILVCHSMGGLVAAAFAARRPDWKQTIEHCIFVGSPLAGSYSAALAIMGQTESFQKMDRYSLRESLEDFQRMAASFPGLIDLLPNPEIFPAAQPLFDIASWPGRVAPDSYWLTQSRNLKSIVWNSPIFEASTHLISQGQPTVAMLEWDTENRTCQPSQFTSLGDGSVLSRSSMHPNLRTLRVTGEHGMLCTEQTVIDAVQAIARKQDPRLPQVTLNDLNASEEGMGPQRRAVGLSASPSPTEPVLQPADHQLAELAARVDSVDASAVARMSPEAFGGFDRLALRNENYDWTNLLSLAIASDLAYQRVPSLTRRTTMENWGFDQCLTFDFNDTQGFVAWDQELVLLSYRGSEKNLGDWLGNLNLAGVTHPEIGKIHRGFSQAFDDALPFVEQILDVAGASSKKVWITGHSLGGALAVLAGAHYARLLDIVGIVTFGQPKLGQQPLRRYFDRYLNGRYLRVVNNRDVVAMIPPNYSHFGKLIHFGQNGNTLGAATRSAGPASMSATEFEAYQPDDRMELDEGQFEELQRYLNAGRMLEGPAIPTDQILTMRSASWFSNLFGVSTEDHSITNAYIPILRNLITSAA